MPQYDTTPPNCKAKLNLEQGDPSRLASVCAYLCFAGVAVLLALVLLDFDGCVSPMFSSVIPPYFANDSFYLVRP